MRLTPIFDTNVFGHLQGGLISPRDWRFLLRHRPARGWQLSNVTALELLAGLHAAPARDYLDIRERIALAYHLSNGRILEDPRFLLCKEILHSPFPPALAPPDPPTISWHMDVIRRAYSLPQLLGPGVPYEGRKVRLPTTSVFADLMAGPKNGWMAAVQGMADETYPAWRELVQQTDRRLPPKMRKDLKPLSVWQPQRSAYVEALLNLLGASTGPEVVAELLTRLDAVLEFTISVTREFLLGHYNLESHQSDVFDHYQLQYLAMDRFVIVSNDRDLPTRTRRSPQSDRIMSFEHFLQTL